MISTVIKQPSSAETRSCDQPYNSNQVAANGEGAALTVLPPAKGVSQGYLPLDVSKESRGFAISAVSEHKDLAFEVLDFAVSEQGRILDLLGTEGTDYKIEDGKYTLLPDHDNWYANFLKHSRTLIWIK